MRVAFVGQSTFFEGCVLDPGHPGIESSFFEFRKGGDVDALVDGLRQFRPGVVVVFRPEVLPAGALAEIGCPRLGFLSEPLPRSGIDTVSHADLERRLWELEQVDPANVDRVVSFDPKIAVAASRVLPIWRAAPLPVADRFYAPMPAPGISPPLPLFVGRSTAYREQMLVDLKHNWNLLHLAFGVAAEDFGRLLDEHNIGVNVHCERYPSFENRVCFHMASGHLVVSEYLDPSHGLEVGLDYVLAQTAGELLRVMHVLDRFPRTWHSVRVRGRRKAEAFRAGRVWPRLLADFGVAIGDPALAAIV